MNCNGSKCSNGQYIHKNIKNQTLIGATTGGKQAKMYIIRVDKSNKRKYIRKANSKWYLDEHRGQYRYDSSEHRHIFVLGNKNKK